MEMIICLSVICILGLILFILDFLNVFYYRDKYKQMAKFNYFLLNVYAKPDEHIKNKILNQFYDYLEKEQKQKQKEYEKEMKKEFKENIKNNINYII